MDFYIIEEENIQNFTPLMEQSYGHDNIYIRMSNDGTLGLMNFTNELAPIGYFSYTLGEIKVIMNSSNWNDEADK